jgi:hypothetical protein
VTQINILGTIPNDTLIWKLIRNGRIRTIPAQTPEINPDQDKFKTLNSMARTTVPPIRRNLNGHQCGHKLSHLVYGLEWMQSIA